LARFDHSSAGKTSKIGKIGAFLGDGAGKLPEIFQKSVNIGKISGNISERSGNMGGTSGNIS
jgi:hypothetical protein